MSDANTHAHEDAMFSLPKGTFEDLKRIAEEMVKNGETERHHPADAPLFILSTRPERVGMVFARVMIGDTEVIVGGISDKAKDAP